MFRTEYEDGQIKHATNINALEKYLANFRTKNYLKKQIMCSTASAAIYNCSNNESQPQYAFTHKWLTVSKMRNDGLHVLETISMIKICSKMVFILLS